MTPGLDRAIKTRAAVLRELHERLLTAELDALAAEANDNPSVRFYFRDLVELTRRRIAALVYA